jgi:aminocarboxymuconate-semialdehyde decarboxylase
MPIDVHAHYIPPQLLDAIDREGGSVGVSLIRSSDGAPPALAFDYGFKVRPFFPKLVEPVASRVAWLDSKGIDHQLVATWPDIYGYGLDKARVARWHQVLNDTLAAWCTDNAKRFSFVASVPLVDAEDAAAELERVEKLGAVAAMLSANVEGTNIGELPLDPLWDMAQRLDMPIMLHPVLVGPAPRAAKFALTQIVQYTFDTTLGIGSLLFSGVFDRFPNLRMMLSHGGGAFPYLAGRFDIMHQRMDRNAQSNSATDLPSHYARRFIYDSIVHASAPLRLMIETCGAGQIVLGTDYSFPPADMDPLQTLASAGLSTTEIRAVADENPRRLFPRIASV